MTEGEGGARTQQAHLERRAPLCVQLRGVSKIITGRGGKGSPARGKKEGEGVRARATG